MTDNQLASAISPYLLQHQHNPVAWRQWGDDALEEARSGNRPILLSVGYAACHWCHVMAHESFEDQETADLMNALFVNIKVDREERPDIDQIYMKALHAMGQQGGWPLTMFLTPHGEPFWGGTYFPKEQKWGQPAFKNVLTAVSRSFHENRDRIEINRCLLLDKLNQRYSETEQLDANLIERSGKHLAELLDLQYGGIKGAPKFPNSEVMEFIFRSAFRTANTQRFKQVVHTFINICQGGIYDHVGGGLSRYAVDEKWLVPHFEKMLYDNAQFISHLSRIYFLTGKRLFRNRLEQTIGWLDREMKLKEGGFAASLDADSDGVEGAYYTWTYGELIETLGEKDGKIFAQAYGASINGNFEGGNILNRSHIMDAPSKNTEQTDSPSPQALQKLLTRRMKRVAPAQDDKLLCDWNALTIAALARASVSVSRESWRELAANAYQFITENLWSEICLRHVYRNGSIGGSGFASDYANMSHAAIALAETSKTVEEAEKYIEDARAFIRQLDNLHGQENGSYSFASNSEHLLVHLHDPFDEAVPNHHGVLAETFSRIWLLTGEDEYRDRADKIFSYFAETITNNPFACASLLNGFDTRTRGQLALIVADDWRDALELRQTVQRNTDAATVYFTCESNIRFSPHHPAFEKKMIKSKPTLYICREGLCLTPITELEKVSDILNSGWLYRELEMND